MDFLSSSGSIKDATRVAIWVHWEPQGKVSEADLFLLRHLRQLGNSIVAVGNRDDQGSPEFEKALEGIADVVLQRPNRGYDFGGYRDGLLWAWPFLQSTRRLIILNNSFYGPFGSLGPALTAADPTLADIWGLTGSAQIRRHIQSFFLIFHQRALQRQGFWEFWNSLEPLDSRKGAVLRCEVPFMASMLRMGLRVRAVIPYEELTAIASSTFGVVRRHAQGYREIAWLLRQNHPMNPTHQLWRWLLFCGVPIVKKELLRRNPAHIPDVDDWTSLVPASKIVPLVEEDLRAYRELSPDLRAREPFELTRQA
jgi:hypothetical protein